MAAPESFNTPDGQQPPAQDPSLPKAQPLPQATPLEQTPIAQSQPLQAQPVQAQPINVGSANSDAARPTAVVKDGSSLNIQQRIEDAEVETDVADVAIRNAPPWLVSAAVHMILLIILGLLVAVSQQEDQISLQSTPDDTEEMVDLLGDEVELDTPLGNDESADEIDPIFTPDNLPLVDDPLAAPPNIDIAPDPLSNRSNVEATVIGMALSGRQPGMKRTLGNRFGSTAGTRKALDRGLMWLVRNQKKDGSWSLVGSYTDGASSENRSAATAMALLAFQGDGQTHLEGKHKKVVARGWAWLIKQQDELGNFFNEGSYHQRFYTNGQCAIAICELYAMTRDEKYKEPAQRAVSYLLKSQGPEGAWRYNPGVNADVSVTGWIVMALQSAKMAGLDVPEESLARIQQYLDKVGEQDGSRYPYQEGHQPSLAMTAEGLLCRQYLGWKRDDPRLVDGVDWLTRKENLIDYKKDPNVYYWYYATQVAHHMEGAHWRRWNDVMRREVPKNQVGPGRRESGSWNPNLEDVHESNGGRLFTTCLTIYMMEVYWRHMPLYSRIYSSSAKSESYDAN